MINQMVTIIKTTLSTYIHTYVYTHRQIDICEVLRAAGQRLTDF
jgi:hypothetical protein